MTKFLAIPKNKLSNEEFSSIGLDIADLGVRVGFGKSKNEIRNFIKGKGIRLDDELVTDPFARVCMNNGEWIILERK